MVDEINSMIQEKNESYAEIRTVQDKFMRDALDRWELRMKPIEESETMTES